MTHFLEAALSKTDPANCRGRSSSWPWRVRRYHPRRRRARLCSFDALPRAHRSPGKAPSKRAPIRAGWVTVGEYPQVIFRECRRNEELLFAIQLEQRVDHTVDGLLL